MLDELHSVISLSSVLKIYEWDHYCNEAWSALVISMLMLFTYPHADADVDPYADCIAEVPVRRRVKTWSLV